MKISFTLTLTSDGEPASGLGTGLLDSLVPRNSEGKIILPASHLKGIMRENLENMPDSLIPPHAVEMLFGSSGYQAERAALFTMDDAVAPQETKVIQITRTSLNEHRVAKSSSLRTGQAIAVGTCFSGALTPHPRLAPAFRRLLKLGLLSLTAVGGGRSRGAGACYVGVAGETRSPGDLLKSLAVMDFSAPVLLPHQEISTGRSRGRHTLLRLIFQAEGPVCAPDIPVISNNVIKTGFSIPASAVQGAILHRINDISPSLADDCFADEKFRAWPLSPSTHSGGFSCRAPKTFVLSKSILSNTGAYAFYDQAVSSGEPPRHISMAGHDGVLVFNAASVEFWKASDMARVITAHGVHHGDRGGDVTAQKRNLFTVEAMAPGIFYGMVSLSESARQVLEESLGTDPFVRLGKARSVRGGGRLFLEPVDVSECLGLKTNSQIFIVQSPICVPGHLRGQALTDILHCLAQEAGLGGVEKAWGSLDIRFGWSRESDKGRLPPETVVTPGSVLRLSSPVDDLETVLSCGLGPGRKQGFGSILPHPGLPDGIFSSEPEIRQIPRAKKPYCQEGFELWKIAAESGISASQISRLRNHCLEGPGKARNFLHRQKKQRLNDIWQRWQPVFTSILSGIETDARHMARVLKVCHDLLAADKRGDAK